MKLVIDGIETEKFNQVNGITNYAVNGLSDAEVNKLMASLYEKHNHVTVTANDTMSVHRHYLDNKLYGYIQCKD